MKNATRFWGTAAGNGEDNTCFSTIGDGTETCNGDGDGKVEIEGASPYWPEMFRLWQHLSNAGVVPGNFVGVSGTYAGEASWLAPGINVPSTRMGNANGNIQFYYQTAIAAASHIFAQPATHSFYFNAGSGLMTPEECWNLDTKIDDGIPSQGIMRAFRKTSTRDGETPDEIADLEAEYLVSSDEKNCNPIIFHL